MTKGNHISVIMHSPKKYILYFFAFRDSKQCAMPAWDKDCNIARVVSKYCIEYIRQLLRFLQL